MNRIDAAKAEAFAAAWIAAWNSRDLERILSHYAEDFEFCSPFIAQVAGEPSGRLRGKKAVGAYWAEALKRSPRLAFTPVAVLRGVDSLVIHYRRHDGRLAAEWFQFNARGEVARSAAHYAG